ncbi:MAG: hypothetical protein ACYCTV_07055 [Leptospirales bacterium]
MNELNELNELNALKKIRNLLGGALAAGALISTLSCSGNTNTTGPAPPLPTGQNGSLNLYVPTPTKTYAGCYVADTVVCVTPPTTPTTGTAPVTALGTEYVSSSASYLLVGDASGNVTAWTTNGMTPPSTTPASCSGLPSTTITGIAGVVVGSSYDVYAVSGSTLYLYSASSSPCNSSPSPSGNVGLGTGSTVGLAVANGYVYGITSQGQYFSVAQGSPLTSSPSLSPLPNTPSTASIGGITADQNGIIFVTDHANSAIYAFYANSNGTLSSIGGTLTGNADISNPKAITTVYGINPTASYCTTGPCEFLYVTNYSGAIAQFVLSINGTAPSYSVGYNEFNAPYIQCEIINPVAMASFANAGGEPGIGNTGSALVPYVFLGQNGTTTGPCFTVTTGTSYGNGVTAYVPTNE